MMPAGAGIRRIAASSLDAVLRLASTQRHVSLLDLLQTSEIMSDNKIQSTNSQLRTCKNFLQIQTGLCLRKTKYTTNKGLRRDWEPFTFA
jgi:hypothetical protein